MSSQILSDDALRRALAVRDLTDPAQGPHALQLVVERVVRALAQRWRCEVILRRGDPVVPVQQNYDALHYAPDAVTRDARYSRYVSATSVLRTHTSAMIPPLLRALGERSRPVRDVLLACPGLLWRRDLIDRLHTGEPHQLDLWRIAARPLGTTDLDAMIAAVLDAVLPGREYRVVETSHPYTLYGRQLDVRADAGWVEVGECGLALPALLDEAGLPAAAYAGLAMGLGLDRLLMLIKGISDIRLLRSDDPRIARQLLDLAPYRPVSSQPAVRRDLSIAVAEELDAELLGDRVRHALGGEAEAIESVEILAETSLAALPPAAVARIGIRPGQKNVLLRLVIRHPTRTLTDAEANGIRNAAYAALHEGAVSQWAR